MKNKLIKIKERGQSIILIVFVMTGVLAIMALAVDGGIMYNNRRKAQTAADAGALRGAREICGNPTATQSEIELVALSYTETENEGENSNIIVKIDDKTVFVQTYVTSTTFIASLIGRDATEITAVALAGCGFPDTVSGAMPIAWSCFTLPVDLDDGDSPDCSNHDWIDPEEEFGLPNAKPWEDQYNYLIQYGRYFDWDEYPSNTYTLQDEFYVPDNLYIVMDTDNICDTNGGTMICDIDGDNDDDIQGAGGRGWIDLDGGSGGANDLANFILGNKEVNLKYHTWFPMKTGNMVALFNAVETKVNQIILLPVYDSICPSDPETNGFCVPPSHDVIPVPDDNPTVYPNGNSNNSDYAHIIGFAPFYVTCVKSGGNDSCPGNSNLEENGYFTGNSSKTIEGFFVITNINTGTGTGGTDTGLYSVFLLPIP